MLSVKEQLLSLNIFIHFQKKLSEKMNTNANVEWLTPADDYICTLPADTQRIAREELREDYSNRNQSIKALREWILQNPRISNCRLGNNLF